MSRKLKLADAVAAVGGVLLLVSSFLGGFSGTSYNSWHSLFVNQLVVTDLLGFVAAVVLVLASLALLPKRAPWTTWAAAVALVVLLNSIFAPLQVHEFLHQSGEKLTIGVGFYVAIIGAVLLVVGACLAWLPFLQTAITGRPKVPAANLGYPDGYAAYQGPQGQFSPPQPGYPGAQGQTQPGYPGVHGQTQPGYPGAQGQTQPPGAGPYGGPTPPSGPSFQPQPGVAWSQGPSDPLPSRPGPAIAGPVGAGSPPAPTGPRVDPPSAWTTPWAPSQPESTTQGMGQPAGATPASYAPAGVTPSPIIQVGGPVDPTPEPVAATPEPVSAPPEPVAAGPEAVSAPPEPVDPASASVDSVPPPVDITSDPVSATPASVDSAPEPVDLAPASVDSALPPVDVTPEAVRADAEAEPAQAPTAGEPWAPFAPEPATFGQEAETPVPRFHGAETTAADTPAPSAAATPWGESQPPPAPPAAFAPFWAGVPVPRTVYSADQSGLPVGSLQPGIWYAVVEKHASGGLIVQLPSGGYGVLVETTDIIRG